MSKISKSARIHPMSIIEDGAAIGDNVSIGPFCHVGPHVTLGEGVELISHVVVAGRTTIGKGTRIFPSAVIGADPQSVHHAGEETTLIVGERNTIREGVTMNTGTVGGGGATIVGNDNLFLAYSHVAHDCKLGNNIILSNNVLLAGHVTVEDRVILGGGSAVHQFVRIGRQAFVGGLSGVAYDVIPYGMLNGNPGVLNGLNVVGMTRAGIARETIHRVRRAYKEIFEADVAVRAAAASVRDNYLDCPEVMEILDFIAAESDRALSSPNRSGRS
ncbi:acyl-ACP--UDP-N-acetylglucosamine O-acyltransferase [Rhizobium sp. KVB221]|uniref:Acyl-[acyl-carrier-protein]--UDP-N-acetylglucosamine O-acyltransferase n=1 Tax=Rhizobium setariae TaxID=2801340 RepID=A0A936YM74_9HYPH|nr:acyl-ACP--UDP-N-acetylglucosamine O-acyltransferase [Rhizobium setariae]MBL0373000.1 acyl-ACP--UDP-N-acetylglucosamine O-acyltransferase [Rhizobium setariae]